jgi:hypothetical protein
MTFNVLFILATTLFPAASGQVLLLLATILHWPYGGQLINSTIFLANLYSPPFQGQLDLMTTVGRSVGRSASLVLAPE